MKLGSGIALLVIGAILSFAVSDIFDGVNLTIIGYIFMLAGAVGILLVLLTSRRTSAGRVSERRTLNDPNTGESVTRVESQDI